MNDTDYAAMIEIPVDTTEIVTKKRRFKLNGEDAKRRLMRAINGEKEDESEDYYVPETDSVSVTSVKKEKKRERGRQKTIEGESKKGRFDIVAAQIAVVVALLLTVLLTNIFWQESGINKLVKSVFTENTDIVEEQDVSYDKFSAFSPVRTSDLSLSEGVMTFSGKGSIYSVADGVVTKVAQNEAKTDKKDVYITFSPSFSALISGVDFAYYNPGDKVYKSVPVCYTSGGDVSVYLYSNGKLLKDYTVDNGKIIWQS